MSDTTISLIYLGIAAIVVIGVLEKTVFSRSAKYRAFDRWGSLVWTGIGGAIAVAAFIGTGNSVLLIGVLPFALAFLVVLGGDEKG
jgi:hypothetical protein